MDEEDWKFEEPVYEVGYGQIGHSAFFAPFAEVQHANIDDRFFRSIKSDLKYKYENVINLMDVVSMRNAIECVKTFRERPCQRCGERILSGVLHRPAGCAFHRKCIADWLRSNPNCPVCMTSFVKSEHVAYFPDDLEIEELTVIEFSIVAFFNNLLDENE